jgi:uncharacterized protein (DUF486 family)
MLKTIVLLTMSNMFMTFAWYGHLKTMNTRPIIIVILVRWGIAFDYTPSPGKPDRIPLLRPAAGDSEIITMTVFAGFAFIT